MTKSTKNCKMLLKPSFIFIFIFIPILILILVILILIVIPITIIMWFIGECFRIIVHWFEFKGKS